MRSGVIPEKVKALLDVEMDPADEIGDLFGDAPTKRTIHVLVGSNVAKDSSLPSAIKAKIDGSAGANLMKSSTRTKRLRRTVWMSVLDYERYKQERKPIPDHAFDFLIKYIKYAAEAMNGYAEASREAKHFIAPVLIMLCSLFVDAKLEVEESVDGNEVHANGNFEFVLTRGKTKKICIVEAKKNDFNQGKVQALIGCEAVADREGLFVVYGIVTDFIKWFIYRCGENSILMDSSTLSVKSEELDTGSMRDVCEMIYGALSDHEEECKKEQLCIE
ncbi:hypothetical protein Plhal304r1_c018g0065571 [Plasmopara halstedii]